jgi:hypothetical protein
MSEENLKVETGDRAKDKVTQIVGIVVVRHDYLYGVARIGIQPEGSHEGKAHEAIHIDLPQAELMEKNVIDKDGMIPDAKIKLGDRCKDSISGFDGICTGLAEWLYSCTKVCITPEKVDKEKYRPAEPCWFDEPQITLIKEEVIPKDKKNTGGFGKSISDNSFNTSSN